MKAIIIGSGRIGSEIAKAVNANGHEVSILVRSTPSAMLARTRLPWAKIFSSPDEVDWACADAVCFAAAVEDRNKYSALPSGLAAFRWLRTIPRAIPFLSVSGVLDMKTLQDMVGDRPVARFLCTPAVSQPVSLRFFDTSGSPQSLECLQHLLPSSSWIGVPSSAFERYGTMLTASALFCSVLAEIENMTGKPLSQEEGAFLLDTLAEAARLIRCNHGDTLASFRKAATPGGITEAIYNRIFRQQFSTFGNVSS